MIVVEMKVYHCTNAEENPIPIWMQIKPQQQPAQTVVETDVVAQFKQNPDAFFPEFTKEKQQ